MHFILKITFDVGIYQDQLVTTWTKKPASKPNIPIIITNTTGPMF
jgi:hypothetical protein